MPLLNEEHPYEPFMEPEPAPPSLDYNSMIGGLYFTQMFNSMGNAVNVAQSQRFQSRYQTQQARFQSDMEQIAARDATRRGEKSAVEIGKSARKVIGNQKAALAAQGLDPNIGSGADLQADTNKYAMEDILETTNNAWREAWGHRVKASELRGQANLNEALEGGRFRQTLLAGGMEALQYGIKSLYFFGGK